MVHMTVFVFVVLNADHISAVRTPFTLVSHPHQTWNCRISEKNQVSPIIEDEGIRNQQSLGDKTL